jgi:hypothetical protein
MPDGKPAGEACIHLNPEDFSCGIWNTVDYPPVCRGLKPMPEMCGESRDEALAYLAELEDLTRPGPSARGAPGRSPSTP